VRKSVKKMGVRLEPWLANLGLETLVIEFYCDDEGVAWKRKLLLVAF
jgi:hypothetical protein